MSTGPGLSLQAVLVEGQSVFRVRSAKVGPWNSALVLKLPVYSFRPGSVLRTLSKHTLNKTPKLFFKNRVFLEAFDWLDNMAWNRDRNLLMMGYHVWPVLFAGHMASKH